MCHRGVFRVCARERLSPTVKLYCHYPIYHRYLPLLGYIDHQDSSLVTQQIDSGSNYSGAVFLGGEMGL